LDLWIYQYEPLQKTFEISSSNSLGLSIE